MTDPFLAEIRVFGFNFPPSGWAFCDGQILPISQNTALFSLLGTVYGGDGKATFALPDLQERAAVSTGQGPGTYYDPGMRVGTPSVTLLPAEMPAHIHQARATADAADQSAPAPDRAMARSTTGFAYQPEAGTNLVPLAPEAITPSGSSLPHNNMPPALVMNFCIALQGVFPQRP